MEPLNNTEKFTETEAFTPSDLASPNPALFRALTRRLEVLMQRHEPDIYPAWLRSMTAKGLGPDVSPDWFHALAYIAAALPVDRPHGYKPDERTPKNDRRMERNAALLVRLVFRGCKKRGEFLSPAEREARLETGIEAEEALYRERYGDAAYHRMIEGQDPQQGQEQQEAA